MTIDEFKEIANELNLECYVDNARREYVITLDNNNRLSANHIACYDFFVKKAYIFKPPFIDKFQKIIRCGGAHYERKFNDKKIMKEYIQSAYDKYKQLKKDMRLQMIEEL